MTFGTELLTTLSLPRPTERQLAHNVRVINTGESIDAYCTCKRWAMESWGTDETSRMAVQAGARKHKEDVK